MASDADLSHTQRISNLDPDRRLQMTFVNDLAYNPVDDRLYCQFYSNLNFEIVPYLGTIDMQTGKLRVIGEMLYYSAYKQSDNQVTLMAIDVIGGSKVCYELGTFNEGVQPVAGLMELGEIENLIDWILGNQTAETMVPTAVAEKTEPKGTRGEASGGRPVSFTAPMGCFATGPSMLFTGQGIQAVVKGHGVIGPGFGVAHQVADTVVAAPGGVGMHGVGGHCTHRISGHRQWSAPAGCAAGGSLRCPGCR